VVVEVAARALGALRVSVPNSLVVLTVLCSCTILGDDSVYTGAARLGAGAAMLVDPFECEYLMGTSRVVQVGNHQSPG